MIWRMFLNLKENSLNASEVDPQHVWVSSEWWEHPGGELDTDLRRARSSKRSVSTAKDSNIKKQFWAASCHGKTINESEEERRHSSWCNKKWKVNKYLGWRGSQLVIVLLAL